MLLPYIIFDEFLNMRIVAGGGGRVAGTYAPGLFRTYRHPGIAAIPGFQNLYIGFPGVHC